MTQEQKDYNTATAWCNEYATSDTYEVAHKAVKFGLEEGRKEGILELFDQCEEFRHENMQIKEKLIWWKKLVQDMCTVMGNSPDFVEVCLEEWVKKMADTEDEEQELKMVENIRDRLLSIKPTEWKDCEI